MNKHILQNPKPKNGDKKALAPSASGAQSLHGHVPMSPQHLLHLQSIIGNQAVLGLINAEKQRLKEASGLEQSGGTPSNTTTNASIVQLTQLATQGERHFARQMSNLFGKDIPPPAYETLRQDLLAGNISAPEVEVTDIGLEGKALAAYNADNGKILLSEQLAHPSSPNAQILKDRALAEETGHHIDHLLRNQYSQVGGDASLDEGARFARNIGGFAVSDQEIKDDGGQGQLEFFEAGGHKDVVTEAAEKAWRGHPDIEAMAHDIYFGNWLRDMSNVYDPVAVADKMKKVAPHVAKDEQWLQDLGFAKDEKPSLAQIEQALTNSALATIEKGLQAEAKATYGKDITAKDVRPYNNVEHIDNAYADAKVQLAKTDDAAVSNHIIESRERTATTLVKAFNAGPTEQGMRLLGSATHTLEDLYAHSNYTEIAINKAQAQAGKSNRVEVWTQSKQTDTGERSIMTTGGFAGPDMGYSLAPKAASALFPVDSHHHGHSHGPSFNDSKNAATDLLGFTKGASGEAPELKHGQKIADILAKSEGYDIKPALDTVNQINTALAPLGAIFPDVFAKVSKTINQGGNALVSGASEGIPTQQSIGFDPNKDLPSHSQLAKDHTDHHFHILSKSLATEASRDVMTSMRKAWNLEAKGDQNGAQAALQEAIGKLDTYFTHPEDQNNPRINNMVSNWVNNQQNAAALERGQYRSGVHKALAELPGMNQEKADKFLQSVVEGEPDLDQVSTVREDLEKNGQEAYKEGQGFFNTTKETLGKGADILGDWFGGKD